VVSQEFCICRGVVRVQVDPWSVVIVGCLRIAVVVTHPGLQSGPSSCVVGGL
jgi:hypothetical protein